MQQPVERGEQRGPRRERLPEVRGVDPPGALDTLDDRLLAGLADVRRLHRVPGCLRPRDAERLQPALVAPSGRLGHRHRRDVGVDALGEVPQPFLADATGDGDLPARDEHLEHLGDVAVVGPARRAPRHHARVGQRPRRQRPLGPQPVQDVLRARLVRLGPARGPGLVARDGPRGHRGAVQREVLGGPQHRVELDEVAAGDGLFEVGVPIAAAEPAPQHEVGAGRDRARRVQLQQRRAADEGEQVRRAVGAQPLRPHRHPPRLRPGELVNRHRDHGRGRPRHRHRGPAALTLAVSPHVLPLLGLTARRATLCWAARPGRHTCVVSSRRHAGPRGGSGPAGCRCGDYGWWSWRDR